MEKQAAHPVKLILQRQALQLPGTDVQRSSVTWTTPLQPTSFLKFLARYMRHAYTTAIMSSQYTLCTVC